LLRKWDQYFADQFLRIHGDQLAVSIFDEHRNPENTEVATLLAGQISEDILTDRKKKNLKKKFRGKIREELKGKFNLK